MVRDTLKTKSRMMCDAAGCTRLGLREQNPVIEGGKRITSPEKGESFPLHSHPA